MKFRVIRLVLPQLLSMLYSSRDCIDPNNLCLNITLFAFYCLPSISTSAGLNMIPKI